MHIVQTERIRLFFTNLLILFIRVVIVPSEVVDRSVEAWESGATEVCLQGGIHPEFTGQFYIDLVTAIKAVLPDMHIHGYTPLEIWQGAETAGTTVRELLVDLQIASTPSNAKRLRHLTQLLGDFEAAAARHDYRRCHHGQTGGLHALHGVLEVG